MNYALIPYPISIIFLGVFWFVVMAVLWKLRTKGKVYYFLYIGGIAATILFAALFGYALVADMLSL